MYIDGKGISGYRSVGGPVQYIGPFSKVNLFIGQNKSGKSNILHFLTKHYKKALKGITQNINLDFASLNRPQHSNSEEVYVAFPLLPNGEVKKTLIERCQEKEAIQNP